MSFLRNRVLCKEDCPPIRRPHMLWGAPKKLFLPVNIPFSTKIFQPHDTQSTSLPHTSPLLQSRAPRTSCPHLDPRSHLLSNPMIFCLCFRISQSQYSVCLPKHLPVPAQVSLLPLCSLLLYLLLVRRSVNHSPRPHGPHSQIRAT